MQCLGKWLQCFGSFSLWLMGHVNVNISLLFCCLTTGAENYARKKRLTANSAVSKYDINECREERRKQNRCKLITESQRSAFYFPVDLICVQWLKLIIMLTTLDAPGNDVWFLLLKLSDSRGKNKKLLLTQNTSLLLFESELTCLYISHTNTLTSYAFCKVKLLFSLSAESGGFNQDNSFSSSL